MYQQLAAFYDNDSREEFSLACARAVLERFHDEGIGPGSAILDLACGTGGLVQETQRHGYAVTGVDLSDEMLSLARQRQYLGGARPVLVRGDIRCLPVEGPFGAVLCFGDVLNHLTDLSDLEAMFTEARRVLTPGGILLADCNTLDTFRSRLWNGVSAPQPWREGRVQVRSMFDEEDGLAHMEAMIVTPGLPTKVERLSERYYSDEVLHRSLVKAGFERIETSPFEPLNLKGALPELSTLKTLWIARSPV